MPRALQPPHARLLARLISALIYYTPVLPCPMPVLQLSRVMELQSRITAAHRGGPLVRHVSMPMANASHSSPYWPAVIVV